MTLSKETLEAATPAAKTTAPAAQPTADLNRLRADAVSLDVQVKVHGSRVTEVVRGVTPHTEPFEEETSTMIVFPHGGVVRMVTVVNVGQMLVLTNQRTNQDAICRVVKVRAYSNTQAYVEVEFTHRQQGYWGVHFPADDEESLTSAAPAAVQAPLEPAERKPVISSVSMRVESLPKAPAPPARNESAFAQIGSREEVQPSASQTGAMPRITPVAPLPGPQVRASAPVAPTPFVNAAPPASRVAASRHLFEDGPIAAESEAEVEAPRSSRTFGTLTGGTGKAAQPTYVPDADAHLDTASSVPAQAAAPRSGNWMWIAACVFFLVAGLSGGALYFRQHPYGGPQTTQPISSLPQTVEQSLPAQAAQPQTSQFGASVAASPEPTNIVDRQSRTPIQQPAVQGISAPLARAAAYPPARDTRPAAAIAPAPAPGNFATSAARPVVRQSARGSETAAPSVAPVPSASAALPDVLSASNSAAPPPPPLVRVRVGGVIVEPKLLHSVAPVYPTADRQAGISGKVVIVAQIEKSGSVGAMKVVSGPITLQGAAMNAMKQWKYQPGTLDGDPIATEVTVTIAFQQQ
jgi:TonB family protein